LPEQGSFAPVNQIITFTTDFGEREHYLGTMKGVVLSINPAAKLIDISNEVASFDVLEGALTISQAYSYYPSDTIHVVVVDPGVGTVRRPILMVTSRHKFVAPDNGVLSLVMDREEHVMVYHLDAEHYFLHPLSNTFHGRDVFSPVAAYLSKGLEPNKLGTEIEDYVRFAVPKPIQSARGLIGIVIRVDKFGNLVTNITEAEAPSLFSAGGNESRAEGDGGDSCDAKGATEASGAAPNFRLRVGKGEVRTVRKSFAEGPTNEAFAIVGSMGYLEIAANRASASQMLSAARGSEVVLEW
jgi:S-adenosyl-L-methionine hydrolase (adenosine-forming)